MKQQKKESVDTTTQPQTEARDPSSEAEVAEETSASAANTAAISELEGELAQVRDQLLRLAADFDNHRKRSRRDHEELRRYGIETLARDLLDVHDNLDRALVHAENSDDPVIQGVKMVADHFAAVLKQHGISRFNSAGQAFDPERHDALAQIPSAEHEPGTVVSEIKAGYMLHDRLLRPAQVAVAKDQPAETADTAAETQADQD